MIRWKHSLICASTCCSVPGKVYDLASHLLEGCRDARNGFAGHLPCSSPLLHRVHICARERIALCQGSPPFECLGFVIMPSGLDCSLAPSGGCAALQLPQHSLSCPDHTPALARSPSTSACDPQHTSALFRLQFALLNSQPGLQLAESTQPHQCLYGMR